MVKHRLHVWCGHITCYRPDHSDHADNTGYAVPRFPPGQQELLVNVTAWDQMIMRNVCCNVDCGVVIRHQTCQRTIADCSNNNNNPSSLTIDNASAVFGTRTRDYRATV